MKANFKRNEKPLPCFGRRYCIPRFSLKMLGGGKRRRVASTWRGLIGRAEPSRAVPRRAVPCHAKPSRAEQPRCALPSAERHGTARHGTASASR